MVRKIAAIPPVLGNRISPNQNRSGKPQQVCYCIYFISSCRMIRTVYYISSFISSFIFYLPLFCRDKRYVRYSVHTASLDVFAMIPKYTLPEKPASAMAEMPEMSIPFDTSFVTA